jgi:hypothetical protein
VLGSVAFTRLTGSTAARLPAVLAVCAAGFPVMALAGNHVVLVVGAVINGLGAGVLLPSLEPPASLGLAGGPFTGGGRGPVPPRSG